MKAMGSHAHDPNVLFLVRDKLLRLSKPVPTLIHWVAARVRLEAEEGRALRTKENLSL
jgi:hypothetical protein